ncbi:MAG: glycine--tRNA ligase [Armatimonadota bacterium]
MELMEKITSLSKRRGFVFPGSEIYGGLESTWDYGPLGVLLKNNVKAAWWKAVVQQRDDMVGLDASILMHPTVWEASGHVEGFSDPMVDCKQCKKRFRADDLEENKCPECGGEFTEVRKFNLMFKTFMGPVEDQAAVVYMRPETAQGIFVNFKNVLNVARKKLPFGIAQIGKAFRNEITPGKFTFRTREFEQMEIEYFVNPNKLTECPFIEEFLDYELIVYSAQMQDKKETPQKMKIKELIQKEIIKTKWHAYWLAFEHKWFTSLGAKADNFRIRQHLQKEKSHYALDTWDLEYKFPFGWKELEGLANRTDFDLNQHIKHSKTDLSLFDEETKKKIIPHVICEPSLGVERSFLVFMFDSYENDPLRNNVVLKLSPKLAPVKVAIFPLASNKEDVVNKAKEVFDILKKEFACQFDRSGSIGRRYARQDEIGTPYCITIDFESLKDNKCTIRDRDSTKQVRIEIDKITELIKRLLNTELSFNELGD